MVIEAMSIGHDLCRGTSVFRKANRPVVEEVSVADLVAATEAQPTVTMTRRWTPTAQLPERARARICTNRRVALARIGIHCLHRGAALPHPKE